MAAVFHWCEDNGAQTGSPLHGTTRSGFSPDTHYATDVNWKNADDCTAAVGGTVYSSSPIGPPPANSMTKYQYCFFASGFNQISAGLFAHTATAFNSNTTLKGPAASGGVLTPASSAYGTPSNAANAALPTDMTSAIAISSGLSVGFNTTGPEASPVLTTLSAPGYSQYLPTQLQIAAGVPPGDNPVGGVTMTFQYNEN